MRNGPSLSRAATLVPQPRSLAGLFLPGSWATSPSTVAGHSTSTEGYHCAPPSRLPENTFFQAPLASAIEDKSALQYLVRLPIADDAQTAAASLSSRQSDQLPPVNQPSADSFYSTKPSRSLVSPFAMMQPCGTRLKDGLLACARQYPESEFLHEKPT